jgi:hypothetical protein
MLDLFSWLAAFFLIVASLGLLLSRDWRWGLGFFAMQYFFMFWLVLAYWPVAMAAVKLVTGWMAAAVIGMTQANLERDNRLAPPVPEQGRLFNLFAAGLVLVTLLQALQSMNAWLPEAGFASLAGALVLIGMGVLQLGITSHPLRVLLGILNILAGFEILYASLENSLLVAGLLATVTLGLALAGSYLLTLQSHVEEAA